MSNDSIQPFTLPKQKAKQPLSHSFSLSPFPLLLSLSNCIMPKYTYTATNTLTDKTTKEGGPRKKKRTQSKKEYYKCNSKAYSVTIDASIHMPLGRMEKSVLTSRERERERESKRKDAQHTHTHTNLGEEESVIEVSKEKSTKFSSFLLLLVLFSFIFYFSM